MKKVLLGIVIIGLMVGAAFGDGVNPLQVMKIVQYTTLTVTTGQQVFTPSISGYMSIVAHAKVWLDPTGAGASANVDVPILANTSLNLGGYIGRDGTITLISDTGTATVNIVIRQYVKP